MADISQAHPARSGWSAIETLLDPPEQIGQYGHEIAFAHVHQLFYLKGLEGTERQTVFLGVEKLSHWTINGIVMQRVFDFAHLHPTCEVGQRSSGRADHQPIWREIALR